MRKFGPVVSATSTLPREHEAIDFLSNLMIAHVPCPEGNMKMKAIYLGLMIRRYEKTFEFFDFLSMIFSTSFIMLKLLKC